MENYITKFNTEAEYNTFKNSAEMPYVNVSYIVETDENKFYKELYAQQTKPFTIEILSDYDNGADPLTRIIIEYYTSGTCSYNVIRNGSKIYSTTFTYDNRCEINAPWEANGHFLVGDKIEIVCKNNRGDRRIGIRRMNYYVGDSNYHEAHPNTLTVKFSGNIMSLFTDDYIYATPIGLDMDYSSGGARFIGECWGMFSSTVANAEDLFLPARGVPAYAFREMFKDNTVLVKGPNIYAKSLGDGACFDMFNGCTALTDMPVIMAQSIKGQALIEMFYGCTSLVNTTPLHFKEIIGTWDGGICRSMFEGCTSLVDAPAWDEDYVNVIGYDNIFNDMFKNCTSLETCDWNLYPEDQGNEPISRSMFEGCTALTKGPSLNRGTNEYSGTVYDTLYNGTYNDLNEFNFGKCSGPIDFSSGSTYAASGTIYVADDSVYLDPNSEYYGQTPLQGWTVVGISNYPTT